MRIIKIKKTAVLLFSTLILPAFIFSRPASGAEPARVLILPFSIHADKDLAYLKKGLADMLASRLALKDQVVVIDRSAAGLEPEKIAEPVNAAAAAALGAKANADYVLFGSLTVLGNNISTDARFFDVRRKQAVLNFSEVGDTRGKVISHIDLLAKRIKEEVFGRRAPSPRPPAAQSAGKSTKPDSGAVSHEHPEKLLDKAAGTGLTDSEESASAGQVPATLWKTRTFKTEIKGFAIGDVDGDKNNETVFISSKKIFIYRYTNRRFTKVVEIKGKPQNTFIGIDVADINTNGSAEIFVTALSDKNRLRSFVLEWNGTGYKPLTKDENWYYRVVRASAGGPALLLGQKGGFKSVFSGAVYELKWDNGRYVRGDKQRLPGWMNVYGVTYGDIRNEGRESVLAIKKNGTLSILDSDGQEEWTSSDTYGGSNIYMLAPAEMKAANKEGRIIDPTAFDGIYLQQRIFVADLDKDKKNEVVVVKNQDVARGLFHRLKKYISGHFEGLIWDNVGLRRKWKTRKFSGYISDYDVSDLDNDGTDELVFAVIAKSGGPLSDAKSYIVSWSLKK